MGSTILQKGEAPRVSTDLQILAPGLSPRMDELNMTVRDFAIGDSVEFTMTKKLPWAGRVLSGPVVRVNRKTVIIKVKLNDDRSYYFSRRKTQIRKHTV